jgi:hypothetical protein
VRTPPARPQRPRPTSGSLFAPTTARGPRYPVRLRRATSPAASASVGHGQPRMVE